MTNIYQSLRLNQEPFSTSPDPTFFYRSKEHALALNRLEIAIRMRRGLSVILGDVGTGKTTLMRTLLRSFGQDSDYEFHMILDPAFKSERQLLSTIARQFGLNASMRHPMEYRDQIEKYLLRQVVDYNRTVVLMIDEGQKLTPEYLEVLRTLMNFETNEFKLLQLVILGQLELLPKLKQMENFVDRINLKHKINPLSEAETFRMIDYRLKQAGYPEGKTLFSDPAMSRIHEYTQGYPRKIGMICHHAISYLIMHEYDMVTEELIDRLIDRDQQWN